MRIKKQASKLNLNSIAEEAAACRKSFKDFPVGGFTLHCHHEILGETLREWAENRIAYIISDKPQYEQALRLRLFRPVSVIQLKSFKKAYADCQKAYADCQKAYADWQKADADRQKAYADCQKAYADWQKADADRQKAYADCQKAYADCQKAYADRQKADADWQKADADWQKADADLAVLIHKKYCIKGCPWDGKTIFPRAI